MDIINRYFSGIVLLRVENKEGFSIYAAALNSSYGDGKKQYVIAFVPDHLAQRDRGRLGDLPWENVQTRTIANGYRLPTGGPMPVQKWTIPRGEENFMFTMTDRDLTRTRYIANGHPLELVLIHDPLRKSQYQYHGKINLIAALSTFKCVISNSDQRPRSISVAALSDTRPDEFVPKREESRRIEYTSSTGPKKATLRYQSVAARAQSETHRVAPGRRPETMSAGSVTNNRSLSDAKVKTENRSHPWSRGPGTLEKPNPEMRMEYIDPQPDDPAGYYPRSGVVIDSSFDYI